ncbi:hypothetical protein [Sphingobium sp. ZW T5_29]|uniref:hypothetical protein n=1 Tax=Sphingobium sp. ZW T5_29 TaxID=3378077 RepID=UPI00385451E6
MIVAIVAMGLASPAALLPGRAVGAAPCHAVPSLCLTTKVDVARPVLDRPGKSSDTKMAAYRFDARPCRIIGNMGCPKQARIKLFRLGEPLHETLWRSFGPR